MTTIRLTFPTARYHATPWGRHVNEGVPEWPPSPYRLLRALYDVWRRKCTDLPERDVRDALEALAAQAPEFHLPAVTESHTRSYLNANSKDPTDKNLVFDPFVVLERTNECFLHWPDVDLSPAALKTLNQLLSNLNFLGRSESWVDAGVWQGQLSGLTWRPTYAAALNGDVVVVGCAAAAPEYRGKQTWLDALTYSTFDMQKQRASAPPLLCEVHYTRPEGATVTSPSRPIVRTSVPAQAVLLGLDSTVLPLATATIEVAEQVRVRLMGAHKRVMNDESLVSPLFSGKTPDGTKRLDHGHIYILPLSNAKSRIDRILLISPAQPFSRQELDAIRGVRRLWQRDNRPDVRCVVTWQGSVEGRRERCSIVESTTPFVPPRHWRKPRDLEQFLVDEIRRECRNHSLPTEPVKIERLDGIPGSYFEIVEYRRNRKEDSVRSGYSFRLTFSEPVSAPFSLGYGAHFGLGQFGAPSGAAL